MVAYDISSMGEKIFVVESMEKLSVIIPCYNERDTIAEIVRRVQASPVTLSKEIIIIDDGSQDGTREILKNFESTCVVIYQPYNRGKGAALRAGFAAATGDIVLIQDADLEYSPGEYPKLIAPILAADADVVYGSRFVGSQAHRVLYFWHYVANRLLTTFSNMCTNLNLTDMETCYKVFRATMLRDIVPTLRSDRFGFEPEITARVARRGARIYEVGISYRGRTYKEGKKINWWDAVKAIGAIVYFNFFDRN